MIPSCSLTPAGLEAQRARQRRLAPHVAGVDRTSEAVTVRFAPGFDRQALDELLAVERECCPFFAFAHDDQTRTLQVTVRSPEHAAALEAIGDLLGAPPPVHSPGA
jgi:hypothetical protein